MKIDVLNIQGEKTGRSVDLPDDVFGIEVSEHAVYLAVKQYRANQRQGTHSAKERNAITGSTRKIKRQKGTGTARAGSIKNPLFRGGGRIFGPRPRGYNVHLNKKVKKLARKSVLTDKATKGKVLVIEDFSFDAPKTSKFVEILKNLGVNDKKTVFVTSEVERELVLSARNIQGASITRASDLNTYQIIDAETLVLSENAIDGIVSVFN